MTSHEPSPAPSNLIGYPFRVFSSENTLTTSCSQLGDSDDESATETHRYGAEICHLIGDMTLEDDCA